MPDPSQTLCSEIVQSVAALRSEFAPVSVELRNVQQTPHRTLAETAAVRFSVEPAVLNVSEVRVEQAEPVHRKPRPLCLEKVGVKKSFLPSGVLMNSNFPSASASAGRIAASTVSRRLIE